jgi:hypothetical protein
VVSHTGDRIRPRLTCDASPVNPNRETVVGVKILSANTCQTRWSQSVSRSPFGSCSRPYRFFNIAGDVISNRGEMCP